MRCWMNTVMAEDNSQNPPPIPRTPYSAGEPPEKTFSSAIIKPNIPPKKKTQMIRLRSVFSISFSILICFEEARTRGYASLTLVRFAFIGCS